MSISPVVADTRFAADGAGEIRPFVHRAHHDAVILFGGTCADAARASPTPPSQARLKAVAARAQRAEQESVQGRFEGAHDPGAQSAALLIRLYRHGLHVACVDLPVFQPETPRDDARVREQGACLLIEKQSVRAAERMRPVRVGEVAFEGCVQEISPFGEQCGRERIGGQQAQFEAGTVAQEPRS